MMRKWSILITVTWFAALATSSARAATATFSAVSATTVSAGTSVVFDVTVAVDTALEFDAADIIIGSNDATDIAFVYSDDWNAAFFFKTTPVFDNGFYTQDVFAGANFPFVNQTSLLLGRITIDTTGMANGSYQVTIDPAVDGNRSNLGLAGVPEFLSGSGQFTIGCLVDADCADGLFCNGVETCVANTCQPGTPPILGDAIACTDDSCDEATDTVLHIPNDALCANGVFCDGAEICDMLLGCGPGAAPDCTSFDDACNLGVCNATLDACTAQSANEGLACDDADACTENDVCTGGVCAGVIIPRIAVNLEIDVLTAASVGRDVAYVMTECGVGTTAGMANVNFSSGAGSFVLAGVNPSAQWISVREGHTLRRLAPLSFDACNQATVNLAGANALVSGDFQTATVVQDDLVDIVDFSVLATRWGQAVPPTQPTGADANGDGAQSTIDFVALQFNFFAASDSVDGCPAGLDARGNPAMVEPVDESGSAGYHPIARIPAADLPTSIAQRADCNQDGVVDLRDIRDFAEQNDLPLIAGFRRLVSQGKRIDWSRSRSR